VVKVDLEQCEKLHCYDATSRGRAVWRFGKEEPRYTRKVYGKGLWSDRAPTALNSFLGSLRKVSH